MYLSGSQLATGVALTVATGLLAGLLPALGAMRLSVVDALRRI
jgi:ABC-type antimicrobial peptide transport system permease subunit